MSPSHAALNWSDADPSVFPSGLRSVYRATGWPVVAHVRAWGSANEGNVYARADPAGWIESRDTTGEVIGLPIKRQFWDDLFEAARECEPPRYRWHLGCILLKMPAISC